MDASLIYESRRVSVWQDDEANLENRSKVSQLAELLDSIIVESESRGWPGFRDVDGDQRLGVCLTSKLENLGPTQVRPEDNPLLGIVRPTDFQAGIDRPYGNSCDVIYLSPLLLEKSAEHQRSILSHEYAHILQASQDVNYGDWLLEAFAHTFESQYSTSDENIRRRLDAFRQEPDRSPLIVMNSQEAGLWRDARSRGAGIRFLNWWRETYGESAFQSLLVASVGDCEKLAEIANKPFREQWRDWAIFELAQATSPHVHDLPADEPTATFEVRGTATLYVRMPRISSGARRVVVTTSSGIAWQATIVTLSGHQAAGQSNDQPALLSGPVAAKSVLPSAHR